MDNHADKNTEQYESVINRIVDTLIDGSHFHPNYGFFQPLDADTVKQNTKSRIKEFILKEEDREKTLAWFEKILESLKKFNIGLVLYGRAVYGLNKVPITDLDTHFMTPGRDYEEVNLVNNLISWSNKPRFVHPHASFFESRCPIDLVCGWKRFGLFNHVLVVSYSIKDRIIKEIDESRRYTEKSGFFEEGVGQLLTYAAFKVADSKESRYFDKEEDAKAVLSKKMPAIVCLTDLGMPSPYEVNHEARHVFKERFSKEELYKLGLAALKRIGVKKEKREELAKKFVKKIKNPA